MAGGDAVRELMKDLRAAVHEAEVLTAVDLLETATKFSSGGLTPRDLAQLDHPFARRHGAPLLDPGEINKQTGNFVRGWTPVEPHAVEDGSEVGIYNASREAEFLEPGTRTMFARPVDDKIIAEVGPRHEKRIEEAVSRVLNG